MSPSDNFSAEREQGDGLSTPKIRDGPAVYPALKLSPAQQEDRFGVWPEWVRFRRSIPAALLAWSSAAVGAAWFEAHPSLTRFSWTSVSGNLVTVWVWGSILLGFVLSGRSIGAWWTARRRILQVSAAVIRGVFGVQPWQSVNFRRWNYASIAFFFAAVSGLLWAGDTISTKDSGFWPDLIAVELFVALLFSGMLLACTRTFSQVLRSPATPDQKLRERFMHDAGISTALPARAARPPAKPDRQLRERLVHDAEIRTASPAPAVSSPIPSGTPANVSESSSTAVTHTRPGQIRLPSWVTKLVKYPPLRWLVATICASIISVFVARYLPR
jgi:hypothetical protein